MATPTTSNAEQLARLLEEERLLSASQDPTPAVLAHLQGGRSVAMPGLRGGPLAYLALEVAARLGRPLVWVVASARAARDSAAELATMQGWRGRGRTLQLPAPDVSPYAGISPDRALRHEMIRVIEEAGGLGPGDALVVPALAWMRRLVPAAAREALSGRLQVGQTLDASAFRERLRAGGYRELSVVEEVGSFSMRRGIIDLWCPLWSRPLRVDTYGDVIDTMRWLDPETQRSEDVADDQRYVPVEEDLRAESNLSSLRERLHALGGALRLPSTKVVARLRELAEPGAFGVEAYVPAFFGALEDISVALPRQALCVIEDPEAVYSAMEKRWEQLEREHERERQADELVFPPEAFCLAPEEAKALWQTSGPGTLFAGTMAESFAEAQAPLAVLDNATLVRVRREKASEVEGINAALDLLRTWREHFGRVVVLAGSRASERRLERLAASEGFTLERLTASSSLWEIAAGPSDRLWMLSGSLPAGFRIPSRGLALVTDTELLGKGQKKASAEKVREATSLSSFRELEPGDLVVHTDFGIGRYTGLTRMLVGDHENDFLGIEYAGKDKLYIPVYRLAKVQKYVGAATFAKLDKLGSASWEKTRERVRKQLADIAEELLRVQAERRAREGFAFSPPDELYREFEGTFPYEETPHQLQALEEILADMGSERPMDRLLCGDVGFGKTEVAIRAAYKAVLDGKQVAVLVPTTVLAEQHLKTFQARLASTPARVESLNRFRTPKETKAILSDLATGRVDVVIGTHRLLSADVAYKDLGLLVVDEEQRFGVAHKEKIKKLRSTVDVLTMTATPIPRTMEMALLGLRDMSLITTPPPGRLSVRTHLARFREATIREALEHELSRGGQVFFVHNRVETIYNVASMVERAVPAARVVVGHAQMADEELERVMLEVVQGKADVLVCTTIIESGIDIPRANTILIHDADHFGLAQLYQLRGRVGRGQERGICYLLVKDPARLSDVARRRLDVLQQHAELGSGLAIAQQDLDIRGAGNMLGRDQSGHIEAIGFELYAQLLEEAVAELTGEVIEVDDEPEVKLPVPAYLPDDYVEDVSLRLSFYKRFSNARTEEALDELWLELEDRYGPPPEPVAFLRDVVLLKNYLRLLGGRSLEGGPQALVFELREDTPLDPTKVLERIATHRGGWEFRPDMKVVVRLRDASAVDMVQAALRAARELESCHSSM